MELELAADGDDEPRDDEGAATSMAAAPLSLKWKRVIGNAESVPSTTLTGATIAATQIELMRAARRLASPNATLYHLVVKPAHGSEKTIELLNEKAARTMIGP